MMPEIDTGKAKIRTEFTLEKFDGEKVQGDGKEPVEILQGGDGLPTYLTRENGIDLPVPRLIKEADLTELQQPEKE